LRARSAPLPGSTSVTMCGRFTGRPSPSTSSNMPVSESRRGRPERFRSLKTMSLIGASMAT
jgi:hypothetical protein